MTQLEYVKEEDVPMFLFHLFFWFSFSLVLLTLPLTAVVYTKIISSREYSDRFVYRLIVINGILNLLQYFFYIPAIHIGIFPALRSIILAANDLSLPPLFLFLFMATVSAQSHSTLAISINRLLHLTHPLQLQSYGGHLYCTSVVSSIILPISFSLPILFSRYQFVERRMENGDSIFRTTMDENEMGPIPATLYTMTTTVLAIICNILMSYKLIRIKRAREGVTRNNKDTVQVENGLVLTTVVNGVVHVILYAIAFLTTSLEWMGAGATLIVSLSLSSLLPFWLLILLVPSLRRELVRVYNSLGREAAMPISLTTASVPPRDK